MPFIENSDNPIVDLSFNFGVRIVKFYKYLNDKQVYVLSKQLLRCGTSQTDYWYISQNYQEYQVVIIFTFLHYYIFTLTILNCLVKPINSRCV